VPSEVLLAQAAPVMHHRTPQFAEIAKECFEGLKKVFLTESPVLIFASSGTGAMESAVVNLLSPGDKTIVIRSGKFGERWGELCEAYGVGFTPIDVEWGKAVKPADVAAALKKTPGAKAVFATHCETSTGVLHPVKELAAVTAGTDAVLVVDAVSSLGGVPLRTDEWGVDVVVTGSQKAIMLPPGLAFASISEKAKKLSESAKCPRYYFDWRPALKSYAKNDFAWTPAVNMMFGLRESLKMLLEEGMENVFARHARLATAVRAAVAALGLELFAEAPADVVTAVKVPEGIDGGALVKKLRDEQGITIAGGQGHVKGKIFRIATMGFADTYDVPVVIAGLEVVLSQLGYSFKVGSGVGAAVKTLAK